MSRAQFFVCYFQQLWPLDLGCENGNFGENGNFDENGNFGEIGNFGEPGGHFLFESIFLLVSAALIPILIQIYIETCARSMSFCVCECSQK